MADYGRGQNVLFRDTYTAGEAMANTYRLLKYSTTADKQVTIADDATAMIAGCMKGEETYDSGETIEVVQFGRVKLKAGGTITRGDLVKASTDGVAITFGTTGAAYIAGKALQSAVSGDIFEAFLFPMFYNAESSDLAGVTNVSGGDLYITTDTDVSGAFSVTGASTLTGALNVTGDTTLTGDFSYTGHKDGQTMLLNAFQFPVPASEIVANADGAYATTGLSAVKVYLPLSGLKVGDELVSYNTLGAVTSSGNTVTVDAKIQSISKAGVNTTLSGGSMTQVSKTANYTMDEATTFDTVQTVATDFHYNCEFTVTTATNTTATINGIELVVNRK
jgi:hypothetical protein